jgi:hypothetical protein
MIKPQIPSGKSTNSGKDTISEDMISQGMTRRWSKAARGVLRGLLGLGMCHAEILRRMDGRAPDPRSLQGPRVLGKRQPEPKDRSAPKLIFCRDAAVMRLNDGPHDGQAHSHPVRFCRVERVKDVLDLVRINSSAVIG